MSLQTWIPAGQRKRFATQKSYSKSCAQWLLHLLGLILICAIAYDEAPISALSPEALIHRLFAASRRVEPRLSLYQAFASCHPRPQPGLIAAADCEPRADRPLTMEYERLIAQAGRRLRTNVLGSSRRGRRDRAFFHLLRGLDLPSLDAAVEHMTAAAGLGREDPATLSDLGALHYLRAAVTGDPRDLEEGLRLIDRALEIEPGQAEARFNRALLVEALVLTGEACEAWREYLRREEKASPWRQEALAHLTRLMVPTVEARWQRALRESRPGRKEPDDARLQRLVRAFPEEAREWIEIDLLPSWAEFILEGKGEEAASRLHSANFAAVRLAGSGDAFLFDLVTEVERVVTGADGNRVRRLAASLLAYRAGRADTVASRPADALEHFRRAEQGLSSSDTCLRDLVEYYQAASRFAEGRYKEASRQFHSLEKASTSKRYRSLAGRAESFLGLIRNLQGAPQEGRDHLLRALGYLADPAYRSDAAFTHVVLGESYDTLGDRELAWQHFYRALRWNPEGSSPYRAVQIYNSVADFTLRQGDLALSYLYQNAAVEASRRLDNPSFAADVLHWRALLQARLGRPASAERDLALAAAQGARITDLARRSRFQADFALITGAMALKEHPRDAVHPLTEAIIHYEALGHWPSLLLAYEALAQAHHAAGDFASEKRALDKSLALYERAGHDLQDDYLRITLAGIIENAFDQMVDLMAHERNPDRAVYYLERAKTLTWPIPHLQPSETSREDPAAVQRLLTPRAALIEYAVLPDRLLIWVETASSRQFYEQPVTREQINRLVGRFLEDDWGSAEWRNASSELFRHLFGPWFVPGNFDTLVLVPDKSLFRISFAALWNAGQQRFLVEDAALVVSPSASLFAVASRRDRALAADGADGKFLVLAASDPGDEARLVLQRLQRARAEGARIRELFPRSTVLLSGAEAVPEAFFQHLGEARFIHFAGHAVASPDHPLDSVLIFASSGPGRRATVTGQEVESLSFPLTRFVALSACSTAAAPRAAWPGALSLARPFLTAGVPTVVGSLWDVDDTEAQPLFGSFYEALRAGATPPAALRIAQLRLLARQGRDHVHKPGWPAFEMLGGPALN